MFPYRMNLVDIELKQVNKPGTVIDVDFREPKGASKLQDVITLKGQVNFGGDKFFNRTERTFTGDAAPSDGHFVFRKKDLDDLSIILQKGDRVISVAGVPMELELDEIRFESSLRGKFLLVYAEFEQIREKKAG